MNRKQIIAVTNRHLTDGNPLDTIRKIAAFGPCALILREKDLTEAEYAELAYKVLEICDAAGVQLFVHSHIETALETGCRAVHLSIPSLRKLLNEQWDAKVTTGRELQSEKGGTDLHEAVSFLSVSCHSIEEVREAVAAGATQIVLGNIFETDCKKGKPGRGLDFLRDAVEAAGTVPVYGIGGITPENLGAVLQTGAAGGCMMSWWYR